MIRILSHLAWLFTLPLGLSGCTALTGVDVRILKNQYPVMVFQGANVQADVKFQKAQPHHWVPIGQIAKVAVGAILVSEDWAFYQHKGFDPKQIKEAIQDDLAGKRTRGASTITQQVVKNVFLSREKTLSRKAKELLLAVRLEELVGKRKILETYLNIAEWGEGVYGIRGAAHLYFDKVPSQLTAREGAFLAMLLPSPIRYGQSFRAKELTAFARRSIDDILDKMVQANYLTPEEREVEGNARFPFEKPPAEAF